MTLKRLPNPLALISKLRLLFLTVLDLKIRQIVFQVLYRLRPEPAAAKTVGSYGENSIKGVVPKTGFISHDLVFDQGLEKRSFCFLNERIDFNEGIDWQFSGRGRLWTYNLHYFQYLPLDQHRPAVHEIALIRDWTANCPPGTPDAWDPFPISLRLVNWIKFATVSELSSENKTVMARSIALQTRFLMKTVEYHLLANHLFKNGKALVFSGLFLKGGREAEKWLQKGVAIVDAEIDEQILGDGGHFERSPMYHSMILEDCLDLLNIMAPENDSCVRRIAQKLQLAVKKMAGFLVSMCHPDGHISLFNDAAFGIEAAPEKLFDYYGRVTGEKIVSEKSPVVALKESGYYILAPDDRNCMIMDCGPVGPHYQPGHAHCDTLSFELSVKGERVVVDSGCMQYIDGDIRRYNRGNTGHNTVTIDGENQSEVWGAHRCATKARPILPACRVETDGRLVFKGGHDGYKRLNGKPIHFREVTYFQGDWQIFDRIEGEGSHSIESRLHIHPDLQVELKGETDVQISSCGRSILMIRLVGDGKIELEKGWYCPEFGKKISCTVLTVQINNIMLPFECGWEMKIEE